MTTKPMPHRLIPLLVPIAGCVALLSACGGGSGSAPQVSNVGAANARFAGTALITVSGLRLDQGITLSIEGPCQNLTTVSGGTTENRQYACDVVEVGDFIATVFDSRNATLARLTVTVPLPRVEVTSNQGSFTLELDAVRAPATVRNFLGYANANFYNNVLVHGAYADRGIITGGYSTGLRLKSPSGPTVGLESDNTLKNLRGTVGLWHGPPDTARAQWYVNTQANPELDFVDEANPGYTVFGSVISGLDVVDRIAAVPTRPDLAAGLSNAPQTEVLVTDVTQTR